MQDRNQLKNFGLKYARALQMVYKTIAVFSVDHQAANGPIQQSFQMLNNLLKENSVFTIGFIDNRILLNNLLTIDKAISSLETEFLKRGIGAVTFDAGTTLAGYKEAIRVITTNPKIIEEDGGLQPFLEQRQTQWVRIFPASKTQARNDSGDTVLEMDSESYLLTKAMQEMGMGNMGMSGMGFDAFANSMGPAIGGSGGSGGGMGLSGGGMQPSVAGPSDIMQLVNSRLDSAYSDPGNEAEKGYTDLAKIIKEMRPEMVLQSFSSKRQEEVKGMPGEQLATEFIEDQAVRWAAERLVSAPTSQDAHVVEDHVLKVLLRSIQATQMAGRMANKLAEIFKDYAVPQGTVDRIQDELQWTAMTPKQKYTALMEKPHYTNPEFRRLIELTRDLLKKRENEMANELAGHYFEIFDLPEEEILAEERSRIPEFLNVLAPLRTDFWHGAAVRLCDVLERETQNAFVHHQIVNSLVALSRNVAVYEDFDLVLAIGRRLEALTQQDAFTHMECCYPALSRLLSNTAADRVIEIFLEKRDDANWLRDCALLLRWSGELGLEKIFRALEEETVTANRLAMLRVIGRVGPAALQKTRDRLNDERWYVVRNACKILGELKDPDLVTQITPCLVHQNERVQQTAVTVLIESRLRDVSVALGAALPMLQAHILELALDELMYLKDPRVLPAVEKFILEHPNEQAIVLEKAVQVLGALPQKHTPFTLHNILCTSKFSITVRRHALNYLAKLHTREAIHLIEDYIKRMPEDSLVPEAYKHTRAFVDWHE